MSGSFMEMLFIDSAGYAQKTGLARDAGTDARTWAEFNSYRRYDVPSEKATFILDYHNRKGDLGGTIRLDAAGFRAITGQEPKAEGAYHEIDRDYWAAAEAAGKQP